MSWLSGYLADSGQRRAAETLIATLAIGLCFPRFVAIAAEPSSQSAAATTVADAAVDLYGDPIPFGASLRLGTQRFRVNSNFSSGIAFSRDGRTIVSAAEGGRLRWWDTLTGELRVSAMANSNVRATAVSPDHARFAVMGFLFIEEEARTEYRIEQWDIDSATRIGDMRWEENRECLSLTYTPDGKSILTGNSEGQLRLWDLASGLSVLDFRIPDSRDIRTIAVSPDGNLVAAVTSQTLFLWKWLEGEEPKPVAGFDRVNGVSFSPDGTSLVISSSRLNAELHLWDIDTEQVVQTFRDPKFPTLNAPGVTFSSDGKLLIVPNDPRSRGNSSTLVWDTESGQLAHRLQPENWSIGATAVSRDRQYVASIAGSEIAVWNLETGERIAPRPAHNGELMGVRFTPDGEGIATASDDCTARVWDASSGEQLNVIRHEYWIRAMSLSHDGRWLATSSLDDTLWLSEVAGGRQRYVLPGHGQFGGRRSVAFSADSARFASWGDDMYLRVWDVATGKALVDELITPGGKDPTSNQDPGGMRLMNDGVLSPDASRLLIWGSDGVYLFDATTGKELKSLDLEKRVESACFTPDVSRLLFARAASEPIQTVLKDGRIRHSGPRTFEFVMMDLHDDSVRWKVTVDGRPGPMSCSPDGTLVAVSSHQLLRGQQPQRGDSILILDAATGTQLASIEELDSLAWGGNGRNMAFSNDNRRLAACFRNTTVLVWNLEDLGVRR